MSDLHSSDSETSDVDKDWNEWEGDDMEPMKCLFCKEFFKSIPEYKEHISSKHNFSFDLIQKKFSIINYCNILIEMSLIQWIKLVNYCRKSDQSDENILKMINEINNASDISLWDKEENMIGLGEADTLIPYLDNFFEEDIDIGMDETDETRKEEIKKEMIEKAKQFKEEHDGHSVLELEDPLVHRQENE